MPETRSKTQIGVGLFILIGLACIGYLALRLGNLSMLGHNRYDVVARFTSASGLRAGAYVEAGGVDVGTVKTIRFDPKTYEAVVTLSVDKDVRISDDATASIQTNGLIGDKFIKISPGGSETYLKPGMEITETEPSINLEELISKYIFESNKK